MSKSFLEIPRFSPPIISKVGFVKSASYRETESLIPAHIIENPFSLKKFTASTGSDIYIFASSELPADERATVEDSSSQFLGGSIIPSAPDA